MNKLLYNSIKYILLLLLFIIINNVCFYAKTLDINGIKADLNIEVNKKSDTIGYSVKEEKEKFSTTEYEKDNKELEDKTVKVSLNIKNNNPYEIANVNIEEIAPSGFRQVDNNENNRIINVKLTSKSEKKYNFNYRYHKSILKEQENSIKYDDDGNIIDVNNDTNINVKDKNGIDNDKNNQSKLDSPEEDLNKGISNIVIFILTFIGAVVLLYAFIMVYRTIRDNSDRFFGNNDDVFKQIVILVCMSILFSLIINKTNTFAESKYIPQIYEYGKNYEKVIYETVDFNGSLYRFAYKITIGFEGKYEIKEEDYEVDTDGDLLVDALEYQYMTDKTNVDTDNDGLSDYIEVMLLDYNPLSDDTFNDGVKDGDRDYDKDGLSNIEEVRLGTDLCNVDTDYDTLSDYDEVNKYGTDPLNIDTDEDLLIDPDELKLGLDPTKPKTDGVTLDSERKIEQEFSMINVPEELREGDVYFKNIKGEVSGLIDNAISIKPYLDENISNSKSTIDVVFKVEIINDDNIELTLDASKVADRVKYLVVVKYENSSFVPVETICNDNNELIATITSGVYTIVDSELLLRELNIYNNDYTP